MLKTGKINDAAPQLIDGKIYIAAGWEGIYSFNVK
jgi:hypothetical protein